MTGANINVFVPPAIRGLGLSGGFNLEMQALEGQSPQEIDAVSKGLMVALNQEPSIAYAFTAYSANVPQLSVNLDRTKARLLNVPVSRVFSTLQANLGSRYVNDINLNDRVFQVTVQADAPFRDTAEDITRLHVRSDNGNMVPLSSLMTISTVLGPQSVARFNQFSSASFIGAALPTVSSGEALATVERIAGKTLPKGYGFDWSGMSYQERKIGNESTVLMVLALLFGYLFLVAQYESWTQPLPVIISIVVAVLGAPARPFGQRPGLFHLCPDRVGAAGGPGGQKCHFDRGVCPRTARSGAFHLRGGRYRRTHAIPGCTDDGLLVHPGGLSHDRRHRSRRGQPTGYRHHGVLRHAGGHTGGNLPDSGALCRFPDHARGHEPTIWKASFSQCLFPGGAQ